MGSTPRERALKRGFSGEASRLALLYVYDVASYEHTFACRISPTSNYYYCYYRTSRTYFGVKDLSRHYAGIFSLFPRS